MTLRARLRMESLRASAPIVEIREETGEGPLVPAPPDRLEDGKTVISLPHLFNARAAQRRFMAYFDRGGKRAFLVAHRRYGKDLTDLHQTTKMAFRRPGTYWHTLTDEAQARKALWTASTKEGQPIMELVFPRAIRESPREWSINASMVVKLKNGSIVQLCGSDNMESLRGSGPVHVSFSEFARCHPKAWPTLMPMLQQNGGTASFLTTPHGKNHAWRLWKDAQANPDWFAESVDIFQSEAFPDPQAVLDEARREGMSENEIEAEYRCSFDAALVGSIWGDLLTELEKHGGMEPFEHVRGGRTWSFWDLGYSDSTAILLAQLHGDELRIVDWYEANHKPISHYVDWLDQQARIMGYDYVVHHLPHDGAPATLSTGMSIAEQIMQRYRGTATRVHIVPKLSPEDGIQAARKLLQGKLRFHPRCAEALELLRSYSYAYNEQTKTYANHPAHDFSSHTSDSFRYLAVMSQRIVDNERSRGLRPTPNSAQELRNRFCIENLCAERESRLANRRERI